MRQAIRILATVVIATVAWGASAQPASAHEKWFVGDPSAFPTQWSFFLRPLPIALVVGAVVVAVVWRRFARMIGTPELRALSWLGRLGPYIPRLLAIHLGVSLLALAVQGTFLSPDVDLHQLPASDLVGLIEGALGVWFISGVALRPAAIALAVIGPLSLVAVGPVSFFEAADLLGVVGFLAVVPPSAERWGRVEPTEAALRRALWGLRVGVATALITLAFSEKFANPALARATLAAHPQLNVFSLVGVHVSTDAFILIAGTTELLFGLLVLSGAAPQIAVLVAGIPFNATLILFGQTEMLGHLPVYGVFLTLLVYGSGPATAPAVAWLPSLRCTGRPVPRTSERVPAYQGP